VPIVKNCVANETVTGPTGTVAFCAGLASVTAAEFPVTGGGVAEGAGEVEPPPSCAQAASTIRNQTETSKLLLICDVV